MVGLPFPNAHSAEWKAKMEHVERVGVQRLKQPPSGQGGSQSTTSQANVGKVAAREFYENACMRAVNQSIGRAIRHQNDFAVICLLDRRYTTQKNIQTKLPGWIGPDLLTRINSQPLTFAQVLQEASRFFARKK